MKNIEIKARCTDPKKTEEILLSNGAEFKGIDNQTDTYFNVKEGRLKIRQGNIENALIFYSRKNDSGPKQSKFQLYQSSDIEKLIPILTNSLGILTIVKKHRKIFFIDFVKFHIDHLDGLGDFVEIEVGDLSDTKTVEELESTCNFYIDLLQIQEDDFLCSSYSDMIHALSDKLS
ncbi:MAG: class IV adenylate cyclase [Saprospiraceae bacterium]|nr:class IV adenylate cyclase [Saprospiraceae bacterium]